MPNRTEAHSAKAALTNATGRLPLLRLFSTLLFDSAGRADGAALVLAGYRDMTLLSVSNFTSVTMY